MTNNGSAEPVAPIRDLPEHTALVVLCGVGVFLSALLAFASSLIGGQFPTEAELAWKVATAAIANVCLLVAVTSGVGAIVLSGVRKLLHRMRNGTRL